jgi:hypothetical protein
MKKILITGGTGLVGTRLKAMLKAKGYETAVLSRQRDNAEKSFFWDPKVGFIDEQALQWADAVVHLAGANVADGRWTAARKKDILDSRLQGTETLHKALERGGHGIKTVVAATAIGWYGDTGSDWADEQSPAGNDFLASVCKEWEQAVARLASIGLRTAMIRVGVVLSPRGGALVEIAKPIGFFAGAALGSGDQYISWIHEDDLCRLFIKALEEESMEGVYNGVAPHPVTNAELTKAIALQVGKPLLLPNVPAFALRLALGEMADIVLASIRVSCAKAQKAGFEFKFSEVEDALSDLLQEN